MKILFLFRDSYDAKYILSNLEEKKQISAIILEKGTQAKKNKLKRIFRHSNLLQYIMKFFDLTALVVYSSIMSSRMKKILGDFAYPQEYIKLVTDDANDGTCIDSIKEYKPDMLFIYGTAILKADFIKSVACPIFNIHTGILPYYRNVHSDFWAYKNEDYSRIGVTIIYLDAGIDSGDIALQRSIRYKKSDSLVDIKVKNLTLIPNLIIELIKQYKAKKIKKIKQDKTKKGFYPTPSFIEIVQLLRQGRNLL